MDACPLTDEEAVLDDAALEALYDPDFQEDGEESESWRREQLAGFYITTLPIEHPIFLLHKFALCLVWLNVDRSDIPFILEYWFHDTFPDEPSRNFASYFEAAEAISHAKREEWLGMTLTDLGNARRLVARHGIDLRFLTDARQWLVWKEGRWSRSPLEDVTRRAVQTIEAMRGEPDTGYIWAEISRHLSRSQQEGAIRAMVNLSQSLPGIAVTMEHLDPDPWLLDCANGMLDLRTGCLRPHRREDMSTRRAPVAFDPKAQCPAWERFLDRITGGSESLKAFLQQAVGYALTGSTREQAVFFLYGEGANGKSTLIETIRRLLGDYAQQADFSAFLTRKSEGPRNDLAQMRGCRLVSASESESGKVLSEVVVKQLSGGDTVAARLLYQEHQEFIPTAKIFLVSNHKPDIQGTDHAIWRRIRLIPFTQTIPDAEQDRSLPEKLARELPGILNWALAGCLAWQQAGRLPENPEVRQATEACRSEMDTLAAFLSERCVLRAAAKASGKALCDAYKGWCAANGVRPLTQRKLGDRLRAQGYAWERGSGGVWFWHGLGLAGRS